MAFFNGKSPCPVGKSTISAGPCSSSQSVKEPEAIASYIPLIPLDPIESHVVPMLLPKTRPRDDPFTFGLNDVFVGRAWRMWGRKLERRTSATGEQLNESVVKLKEIRDTLWFFYSYDWNFNGYNGIYIYIFKIILLIITTLWKDTLW